ncbi:retropepsin-like aspartic protease [Porphyromonas sp.]
MRINGQELEFLFDTGASSILISKLEAELLEKQGRISAEDIEGTTEVQVADGRQVTVRCLNLREVELAGVKLYNIPAYVTDNADASLLLGQTAMARFGAFKVDYKNETITFE